MTAFSEDYELQIIDSCSGKSLVSDEDVCQVELHGTSIIICPHLRVNWFIMMERLAQYWLLDLYTHFCDQSLTTVGQLRDQIMMGKPRQRWQRYSDHVEDDFKAEEWCNARYINTPKKVSYRPGIVHGSPHHMAALWLRLHLC